MSNPLASFRELKGIEPAIETRLHEAGVYTWEALAEILEALGDVEGSTQRELIDEISARVSEAGGDPAPRPPNGERSEKQVIHFIEEEAAMAARPAAAPIQKTGIGPPGRIGRSVSWSGRVCAASPS